VLIRKLHIASYFASVKETGLHITILCFCQPVHCVPNNRFGRNFVWTWRCGWHLRVSFHNFLQIVANDTGARTCEVGVTRVELNVGSCYNVWLWSARSMEPLVLRMCS